MQDNEFDRVHGVMAALLSTVAIHQISFIAYRQGGDVCRKTAL